MRVLVGMVMTMLIARVHRHQAAVSHFANHVLELQRRMVDPKALPQHEIDVSQDPSAF